MLTLQQISEFNDKFRKGEELELSYVKETTEYILANEDMIKAQLKHLKVVELKKMLWNCRSTKKADIIDDIYRAQAEKICSFISGIDSMTYVIDGHSGSFKQQLKSKLDKAFAELTEEKLKELLAKRKLEHEAKIKEEKQFIESIKSPKSLQDFEKARDYRPLTVNEQRVYEELKASEEKDKEKEKELENTKQTAEKTSSSGGYSIEKRKDTRDERDLWVVRFKEKLDKDQFREVSRQMKSLGGSRYSRFTKGFNFYFDPSEKLNALYGEDENTATETASDSKEVDNVPVEVESLSPVSNKAVKKLRTVADNLQKEIDNKLNPDRLANTTRRATMAANAEAEGMYLKKIQTIMRNIAELIENGDAKYLDKISAKTHIETLEDILREYKNKYIRRKAKEKYPDEKDYSYMVQQYSKELSSAADTLYNSIDIVEYPLTSFHRNALQNLLSESSNISNTLIVRKRIEKLLQENNISEIYTKHNTEDIISLYDKGKAVGKFKYGNYDDIQQYKRLKTMGIKDTVMLRAALREYYKARGDYKETEEEKKARELKEIQRSIIGIKIPGYFPTPKSIVEEMLSYADIQEGNTILEPSAGSGHIADLIKEKYPDNKLAVIEFNSSLSKILEKKGYNVAASDFLEYDEKYDKIIMNPPFEKDQDVEHVFHAFSLLNPGGKVVAIMSEHPFFAEDKKSQEFRHWLESQEQSFDKKLPEGSFLKGARPTGVNTRIVVLEKPAVKELSLYDQLNEDKLDIFGLMREGVDLNKYDANFNNLYHKKILSLLQNKDNKLKEKIEDYLIRYKLTELASINAHELSRIINSRDFGREGAYLVSQIITASKELIKEDMPYIKKCSETYLNNIDEIKIGLLKGTMSRSIRLNARELNISANKIGAHFELFSGEGHNIELLNEVVTLFNKMEVDLIKAGTTENVRNVLEEYKNIFSNKKAEASSDMDNKHIFNIWEDFKMAVAEYLDSDIEKYTEKSIEKDESKDECIKVVDSNEVFRYYLTNRPPSIGTQPAGAINVKAFDNKEFVKEINREAWGYVEYNKELTPVQVYDYELIEMKSYEVRKEEAVSKLRKCGVAYNGVKSVRIVPGPNEPFPISFETGKFNVEAVDRGIRIIANKVPLTYENCLTFAIEELFYEEHSSTSVSAVENIDQASNLEQTTENMKGNKKSSRKNKSKIVAQQLTFEQLSLI